MTNPKIPPFKKKSLHEQHGYLHSLKVNSFFVLAQNYYNKFWVQSTGPKTLLTDRQQSLLVNSAAKSDHYKVGHKFNAILKIII